MAALTVRYPEPLRMSEEEYLQTVFEPDADFVDGIIEERPMGEFDHSTWQEALQAWFRAHYPEWQLRARPELRCKVSPTRYRIPDVAVTAIARPVEQIPVTPPVAVLEVLSPDDRVKRMMIKLGDYERMGIRNVFLIDPEGPVIFRFKDGQFNRSKEKSFWREPRAELTGRPSRHCFIRRDQSLLVASQRCSALIWRLSATEVVLKISCSMR